MADPAPKNPDSPAPRPRRRALWVLLWPLVFLAGTGGGFLTVSNGYLAMLTPSDHSAATMPTASGEIAFIPLEPILINLGTGAPGRFLRFQAQIEVSKEYQSDVTNLIPRVMDVLNGYLRAVDPAMLEDRSALVRLKAQMLRRLQLVVGSGKVRDLLVMEFVVS